jgi:hypothetical protein
MVIQGTFQLARLADGQEKEGYWIEDCEDRVLVWHSATAKAAVFSRQYQ